MEVIRFQDFMDGSYKATKKRKTRVAMGIVSPITIHSFLNMSPEMLAAYAVVGGLGLLLFLASLYENSLIKNELAMKAESMSGFIKFILTMVTTGAIGYYLFNNPMWSL